MMTPASWTVCPLTMRPAMPRLHDKIEVPNLLARLFPMYYKASHPIAQLTMYLSLPDVRPGLTKKFQFENSAKPDELLLLLNSSMIRAKDTNTGNILVNRVRYKEIKFRKTHLLKQEAIN